MRGLAYKTRRRWEVGTVVGTHQIVSAAPERLVRFETWKGTALPRYISVAEPYDLNSGHTDHKNYEARNWGPGFGDIPPHEVTTQGQEGDLTSYLRDQRRKHGVPSYEARCKWRSVHFAVTVGLLPVSCQGAVARTDCYYRAKIHRDCR